MHLVFIDDTGTKEQKDTTTDLFSYVGIIFENKNAELISSKINGLKNLTFTSTDIELKSR